MEIVSGTKLVTCPPFVPADEKMLSDPRPPVYKTGIPQDRRCNPLSCDALH